MYVDENGNGHFNGTIHASDGSFVGTVIAKNISATKGTIGGWDIQEYSLSSGDYNNNFIQFDSSDGYYTTSLLLNYGLNPNGDKQDEIIYRTTKVTGEISLESNIKLNNNSFLEHHQIQAAYTSPIIFLLEGEFILVTYMIQLTSYM